MQSLLIFYATFLNNKKTCKNRHLRTFVIPKIDWWCLWRHHALCLKALDLYYPAKTYMMKISCVERHIFNNLCKALPSKITKNYTFSNRNSLWMAFGEYQNEKIATFLRLSSQNLIHVSWDHPVWFCGYPRTQRCLWKQILNSKVIRNFFAALEVKPSRFVESIFWWFRCDFHENPWKSWTNRYLRTSA